MPQMELLVIFVFSTNIFLEIPNCLCGKLCDGTNFHVKCFHSKILVDIMLAFLPEMIYVGDRNFRGATCLVFVTLMLNRDSISSYAMRHASLERKTIEK